MRMYRIPSTDHLLVGEQKLYTARQHEYPRISPATPLRKPQRSHSSRNL